jgi:hypothetical protein
MKDVLPPVHTNDETIGKKYWMLPIQNASNYRDSETSSSSAFDAIWKYIGATKILLRCIRHKHTKGRWINSGFQERVPSCLEGK